MHPGFDSLANGALCCGSLVFGTAPGAPHSWRHPLERATRDPALRVEYLPHRHTWPALLSLTVPQFYFKISFSLHSLCALVCLFAAEHSLFPLSQEKRQHLKYFRFVLYKNSFGKLCLFFAFFLHRSRTAPRDGRASVTSSGA